MAECQKSQYLSFLKMASEKKLNSNKGMYYKPLDNVPAHAMNHYETIQ